MGKKKKKDFNDNNWFYFSKVVEKQLSEKKGANLGQGLHLI